MRRKKKIRNLSNKQVSSKCLWWPKSLSNLRTLKLRLRLSKFLRNRKKIQVGSRLGLISFLRENQVGLNSLGLRQLTKNASL